MIAKKKRSRPAPKTNMYRCPGCGDMVDKNNVPAIREHHQHVLRPRLDSFVTLPFVHSTAA
jgi:hypothetical protein